MTPPDTNLSIETRRHSGPLIGMGVVVVFALVYLMWWLTQEAADGQAPQGAATQIDGRTGMEETGTPATQTPEVPVPSDTPATPAPAPETPAPTPPEAPAPDLPETPAPAPLPDIPAPAPSPTSPQEGATGG